MAEKLTVKKVLAIVVLTTMAVLGYFCILMVSLVFTRNIAMAWLLSFSFIAVIVIICIGSAFRARKIGGKAK